MKNYRLEVEWEAVAKKHVGTFIVPSDGSIAQVCRIVDELLSKGESVWLSQNYPEVFELVGVSKTSWKISSNPDGVNLVISFE